MVPGPVKAQQLFLFVVLALGTEQRSGSTDLGYNKTGLNTRVDGRDGRTWTDGTDVDVEGDGTYSLKVDALFLGPFGSLESK